MTFIFKYYLWVILVMLIYIGSAYTTNKLNTTKDNIWFYLNWSLNFLPIWAFIAKGSKTIVFDGMLFDVVMVVTYTISILLITRSFETMKLVNYIGIVFVIVGLTLFKYNN